MLRRRRETVTFGFAIAPGSIEHPVRIGEGDGCRGEEHVIAVGQFEPRTLRDLIGEDAGVPRRLAERVLEVGALTAPPHRPPHRLAPRLVGEPEECAAVAAVAADQSSPALPDADEAVVRGSRVLREDRGERGQCRHRHPPFVGRGELATVGRDPGVPVGFWRCGHDARPLCELVHGRPEGVGGVCP